MGRASRKAFATAVADLESQTGSWGLGGSVRLQAEPPALATRFRAGEGAAAALATGAAIAARIGLARGSPAGTVRLASRHVEASLLSFAYLAFLDPAAALPPRIAPEERTAAAGFHRTRDGRWIYLHPGFPHNTEGLLRLLGVADDREAVRSAVAAYDGDELEDAIATAGLTGALVRSAAEWDESLAGRVLAARPVVDVVQLNDTEPEPMTTEPARALQDVRVLDLTRVLAGPTCGRTLASYGAQVLRIAAPELPFVPLFVADTGFGKRSAHLDLTRPDHAQRLRRLVRDADVFTQSYRTGAMDRLGFGVTEVAQLRPGIVYVSINCYGHEGPWRKRPGWEQLAQVVTGIAHQQGADQGTGRPALLPAAVADYTTGYLAAFGTLVALERRARLGGSYWVRVSLARTATWIRALGLRRDLDATPHGAEEIAALQNETDSPWGRVRFLRPAVTLTDARVGWELPPVPLGTHPPEFA